MPRVRLSRALSDLPVTARDIVLRMTREVVPTLRELIRAWNDWIADGSPGAVTVRLDGVDVGQREVIHIHTGTGITPSVVDDSTNAEVDVTFDYSGSVYTDAAAQDAVGSILVDSTTIDFTYVSATSITAVREALTGAVKASKNSNATIFGDLAARSLLGVAGGITATPAAISASASSDAVMRNSGTTIGWGTVATGGIASSAVTNAKLANMAAGTIKLRALGSGTGAPVDGTLTQSLAIITEPGTFATSDAAGAVITLDGDGRLLWQMTDAVDGNYEFALDSVTDGMHGRLVVEIDSGGPYASCSVTADSRTVLWCGGSGPSWSASTVYWIDWVAASANGNAYLLLEYCEASLGV